ncbi:MAG: TolC family protein [Bacteroidales bacterium]|jgi:hypothetical protein|nr:TolC family protein [Bacteroidales bacterium]
MNSTKLLNFLIKTLKFNILAGIFLIRGTGYAQSPKKTTEFTLGQVCKLAKEKYPYIRNILLNREYGYQSQKSADAVWLPQISLSGKTSFQSEITSVSIPKDANLGFSIAPGEKFQYQGVLSVKQIIYDGGTTRSTKRIAGINTKISEYGIRTSMLQVKINVEKLFEQVLITKERIKMLDFKEKDLLARKKDISEAVSGGMVLKSVLLEIETEIADLEQQKIEAGSLLQKYCSGLSFYTMQKIDTSAIMLLPDCASDPGNDFSERPDYMQFEKRVALEKARRAAIGTKEIPQVSLFANGYYGRPGLNNMNYDTHFCGITGISMNWNIGGFYNSTHKKKEHEIAGHEIINQQEIFEIELNRQLTELNLEIERNKLLMAKDKEMVEKRTDIKKTAEIQMENGAITFADYYTKLTDEAMARANLNIHKISLVMDIEIKKALLNK